jgi:hypothetical protein
VCTTKRIGIKSGFTPEECSVPPTAVYEYDTSSCPAYTKLSALGAQETGTIYEGTPAACNAQTFSTASGFTAYDVGAALPNETFAKLMHVPTSATPLGVDTITVDTGEVVEAFRFWDPVHMWACDRSTGADGTQRCLPSSGGTSYFADAQCKTTPLLGVQHPPGCASPYVQPFVLVLEPGTCTGPEGPIHVYKVGAKVTPATVYQSCTPMTPPANMDFYTTTGEVPASELVEITESME